MTRHISATLRAAARVGALALTATFAACGGDGGNDTPIQYDNHLPLEVGDRRIYRNTATQGALGTYTNLGTERVTATGETGGTRYHVVQSEGAAPGVGSSIAFSATASVIQSRSPVNPAQSIDIVRFPAFEGGSFVQDWGPTVGGDMDGDFEPDPYTTRQTTVVLGAETVSTPAGTYAGALHLRDHVETTTRLSTTGAVKITTGTRDTWYAPGVGRVRSEWRSDAYSSAEELLAYAPGGRPRQDTTPPALVSVTPASGTSIHAGTPLVLTFDEPVTERVLSAVTVTDSRGLTFQLSRSGPADPTGRSLMLRPVYGWTEGAQTLHIAAGIEDFAGNVMAALPDRTFTVSSDFALVYAWPSQQATNVSWSTEPMEIHLNKPLDPATASTVRLRENGAVVPATVTANANGLSLLVTPAAALKTSTRYAVDLGGLRSNAGLSLANPQDWTFTTAATMTTGVLAASRPLPAR